MYATGLDGMAQTMFFHTYAFALWIHAQPWHMCVVVVPAAERMAINNDDSTILRTCKKRKPKVAALQRPRLHQASLITFNKLRVYFPSLSPHHQQQIHQWIHCCLVDLNVGCLCHGITNKHSSGWPVWIKTIHRHSFIPNQHQKLKRRSLTHIFLNSLSLLLPHWQKWLLCKSKLFVWRNL